MASVLTSRVEQVWDATDAAELTAHLGRIGRIQTLTLTSERRDAMRAALGERFSDETTTLADFCPDPLVLALGSGLPRVALLDHVVDGGSEWEQFAELKPGSLTAVSRIAQIVERTTSAGRRMIRTSYETEFRDERGVRVGVARGFSLDIEEARA
jgi:hypothetical protein